jgi:hypothetical protein
MNFNSELLTLLKSVGDGYESRARRAFEGRKLSGLSALEGNDPVLSSATTKASTPPSDIVRLLHRYRKAMSRWPRCASSRRKGYLAQRVGIPSDQRKQPSPASLPKRRALLRKDRAECAQAYFACLFQGFDARRGRRSQKRSDGKDLWQHVRAQITISSEPATSKKLLFQPLRSRRSSPS